MAILKFPTNNKIVFKTKMFYRFRGGNVIFIVFIK